MKEIIYKNKRILYLDLLRILSTFAMVLLHVVAYKFYNVKVDSYEWQVLNVYDSMVRFCVPIFVMISGVVFLNPNYECSISKLYKDKIFKIIITFVFWSSVYALIESIKYDSFDFIEFALKFVYGHYHLWFLYMIVGLYIMVPFLRKICSEKTLIEYFLILSFIFCFCLNLTELIPGIDMIKENVLEDANIFLVLGYTGYFVLGYYLNQYNISSESRKKIYILGIVSLIFTIVMTSVFSLNNNYPQIKLYEYLTPNILFVSTAIFVLFKEKISKIKINNKIEGSVVTLSDITLGIYLIHDIYLIILKDFFDISSLSFNPLISVPVITFIVFWFSLISTYFIKKCKIGKYIV